MFRTSILAAATAALMGGTALAQPANLAAQQSVPKRTHRAGL